MTSRVAEIALDAAILLAELAVLLVLVAAAIAVLARRVGIGRLQRWLGGGRLAGALKGMALGFATPFCTYSAIPVFVGMVDARIRTATVAGFLLAAPVLDPIVLAVLVLLFGWPAAAAYTVATFATVLVLALVADVARAGRWLRPAARLRPVAVGAEDGAAGAAPTGSVCAPDPFTDQTPWRGWRPESGAAVAYALGLARGLALPMVAAVVAAALILGFVPDDLLARVAGPDQPFAVPVAALIGAPFYVATEAFLPIASALHASGMGVGAVFALVISAAGVNLPELGLLSRLMAPRLLATYTLAVLALAVAAGYLAPVLL